MHENVEIIPTVLEPTGEFGQFKDAIAHYGLITQFVSRVLKKDTDYGLIKGTKKPTLYKAGAEKLCQLFKLRPEFVLVESVTDWTGKEHGLSEPLFYFNYKCVLYYPRSGGHPVGEGIGSCNSLENKYRGDNWNWNLVNTIDKISQKRAFVASVLFTTGVSAFFSQDLEDWQQVVNGDETKELKKRLSDRAMELVNELGWKVEDAQKYLLARFGVKGRMQLSVPQLQQLLQEMEGMLRG